jgi:hypothetical protein
MNTSRTIKSLEYINNQQDKFATVGVDVDVDHEDGAQDDPPLPNSLNLVHTPVQQQQYLLGAQHLHIYVLRYYGSFRRHITLVRKMPTMLTSHFHMLLYVVH